MRTLDASLVSVEGVFEPGDEGFDGWLGDELDDVDVNRAGIGEEDGLESSLWSSALMSLFRPNSPSYTFLIRALTSVSLFSASCCDLMISMTCSLTANVSARCEDPYVLRRVG